MPSSGPKNQMMTASSAAPMKVRTQRLRKIRLKKFLIPEFMAAPSS